MEGVVFLGAGRRAGEESVIRAPPSVDSALPALCLQWLLKQLDIAEQHKEAGAACLRETQASCLLVLLWVECKGNELPHCAVQLMWCLST